MARARRLTTEEAAERLGLSVSRITELARNGELGRKEGGRWTFSAAEVQRVARERDDRAKAITRRNRWDHDRRQLQGLPLKRRKKPQRRGATDAPSRSRQPHGLTMNDMDVRSMLDDLLAHERVLEQRYQLPFRAPHRTETVLHHCTRCDQPLLFLIFGDHATDAAGLDAYGRLMEVAIRQHGVPAYVLSRPADPGDDTVSLLRRVWPDSGAVIAMTPNRWESFVGEQSQAHDCAGAARHPGAFIPPRA